MKYDPYKHHRRSIRLKGFDYCQNAAYFITIVTQGRECLFGDINNGEMRLNDAGKIVTSTWLGIQTRFPIVQLDEFIVMPNHFHAILTVGATLVVAPDVVAPDVVAPDVITPAAVAPDTVASENVGATLVVAPDAVAPDTVASENVGATLVVAPDAVPPDTVAPTGVPPNMVDAGNGAGTSPAPTLGDIVGAFKSIATHEYILAVRRGELPPFAGKIWQRNYYEHIIRNEQEWERIRRYIYENPIHWEDDPENPAAIRTGRER